MQTGTNSLKRISEPGLVDFTSTYDTEIRRLTIAGKEFNFFLPQDINTFINQENPLENFPLWAKPWEAALVLADYVANLPPDNRRTILEIGSGLGIVGVIAAGFGHKITITEYDPVALDFIRANCLLNGCRQTRVAPLDWTAPCIQDRFDFIIGSEVVYRRQDIARLKKLFDKVMQPEGKVILAEQMRKTCMDFWKRMADGYSIKARKINLNSADGPIRVAIFELTRL